MWWVLLPREGLKGSSVGGDGSTLDDPENGVTLWSLFREKMEDFPLEVVRGALLEDMEMEDRSSGDGDERDAGSSG